MGEWVIFDVIGFPHNRKEKRNLFVLLENIFLILVSFLALLPNILN